MDVNLRHPANVSRSILVTELGIVMEVRSVPKNAQKPISVTELGIVIEVRPVS